MLYWLVRIWLVVLGVALAVPVAAQQIETDPDVRPASRALVGGGHLHTFGVGVDVQYSRRLEGKWDRYELKFSGALSSYKDRDEGRIASYNDFQGGSEFIFGKVNFAYFLGLTAGAQRILIERSEFNRVQVKAGLLVGPTIAILKPYLIDILVPISPNSNLAELQPVVYNSSIDYTRIFGESDYFQGFDRITARWGLRVRSDFTVDLSGSSYFVRAINFGVQMDMFPRQVPIMLTGNQQTYFSVFGGLVFGSAW